MLYVSSGPALSQLEVDSTSTLPLGQFWRRKRRRRRRKSEKTHSGSGSGLKHFCEGVAQVAHARILDGMN